MIILGGVFFMGTRVSYPIEKTQAIEIYLSGVPVKIVMEKEK